ncbi:hypothetical protein [Enterococcus casseliflavus]|uniref:hypothetical protein n=1 Tax=Enterococcus casseliflavus TaxID=37734 RepID=UPI00325BBBEC
MFVSNSDLIFDRKEDKVSAKGNPYAVIHLIDTKNYQRLEFFADENLTINCGEGAKCKVVLKAERRGFSTNLNCLSVTAA